MIVSWRGRIVSLISAIGMMVSGCGMASEPASLIQPPMTAASLELRMESLQGIVQDFLPAGAKLIVPAHPVGTNAVSQKDMDEDGTDELIAAYKVGGAARCSWRNYATRKREDLGESMGSEKPRQ